MSWQALQAMPSNLTAARTPDSAALSITDNLDIRVRIALVSWSGGLDEQTFAAKRAGGDEWMFHLATNGRLAFIWWSTGGTPTTETASVDHGFTDGTTHWVRVRRAGTSVFFYTSDDDTNDHTAVSWTQLGATQSTPSGDIRSTVSTFVNLGSTGGAGNNELEGYYQALAIVNDATTVASPVFADPDEWVVGSGNGDTGTDAQGNVWTLGGGGLIVGSNIGGAAVQAHVGFGSIDAIFAGGSQIFDPGVIAWTDITEDMRAADTSRGRSYELDRFDAGTMSTELENFDGKYHSHNTASPYYPDVKPMVPIRLRAVYEGTVYPIWTGFVQRWPVTFPGNIDSLARVESVDLFQPLSLADASQTDRTALVEALGPVAWWRFADNTDEIGGHDLTFNGSPSSGEPGAWTGDVGTLFDGTDDYATVASESDIELASDMSIEVWFRPSHASSMTVETFNADDTWTCPANVRFAVVECWGPGGGGEAGESSGVPGGPSGAGGGGGAYARSTVPVVPGTNYTINIGTVGAAGTGGGGNGGTASSTIFGNNLVHADGGYGGAAQVGGDGGQASLSAGEFRRSGGRGGDGLFEPFGIILDNAGGGGGGGAAGASGSNQTPVTGGAGQQPPYPYTGAGPGGQGGGAGGDGGNGGTGTPTNGTAGTAPGGGGGGGGASGSGDGDGGAGAAGRIKVSYITEQTMTLISDRGADTSLYNLAWDGFTVNFGPGNSATSKWSLGLAAADVWHHAVVTIDWDGGTRHVRGYLNGVLTLDQTTGYTPPAEVRAVNIGRRATAAIHYFKGDISEMVVYDTVLTGQDVSGLYAAQLEGWQTERTDQRIEYVLTTAEVGVGVEIDTGLLQEGQSMISGPNSPTEVSALEAIQIAADTEQGQFFMSADGRPVFHDRYHRLIDQATPVATIDESEYVTLELYGKDERFIYNQVKVFPSDVAVPFIVTDETSEDEYGRRTLELTTYPADENEGFDMAVYLLDLYKQPADRIAAIHWEILEGVTPIDLVLGAEIGNRYTVTAPLAGDDLSVDVYLERITHNMTGIEPQQRWTVTWEVSPAGSEQAFWLLGVAGFGELDNTTRLGF